MSTKVRAQCVLWQLDPFTGKRQILILRKCHNGVWGLPGGAIEEGESPTSAMIRELVEETQLDTRQLKLDKKIHEVTLNFKYGSSERHVMLGTCQYLTPKQPVNISVIDDPQYPHPEHFEFRWVTYKDELKHLEFGSDDIKDTVSNYLLK